MRTRNINIKELKNSLRLHSRSFRENMEENRKRKADASIFRRLTSLREYVQARWIYTYVSKPIEVD
ncbi:MAG TPA: 5-formyltetrahydrofolate cyclo-ligase, partial [Candidatus Caccousia stercoris]|nr:5-formyltetrahydrofolate cyclo-ligase [Candidatus Caccousia stercoris]